MEKDMDIRGNFVVACGPSPIQYYNYYNPQPSDSELSFCGILNVG